MDLEDRIILPFWSVTILEDVQRILAVPRPSPYIPDGVGDIRIHLIDDHV